MMILPSINMHSLVFNNGFRITKLILCFFLNLYRENKHNEQEELNQVQTYSYYKFVPMAKHREKMGRENV